MSEKDLTRIRLIIADDHPIVRQGLRILFESSGQFEIVHEFDTGHRMAEVILTLWPGFDVLILDAHMPHFQPISVVSQLVSALPEIKIIVLSSYDNPEYVTGLLNAGCRGYILKDESPDSILSAVRIVHDGDTYMSPKVASVYVRRQRSNSSDLERLASLTEREREVLSLVGKGYDNSQICNTLVISYETVKNHLRNIYGKLGVENRYQAILFAIRVRLVDVLDM